MKIGITCYPTVGGSGVIATELGMMLADRGNEIHFITSSLPFRLNQVNPAIYFHEVEPGHYPVFQYPPYDLALASKMAEVIDREELDILHVHYAMPHAICAILARDIAEHKVKIVTTLHGTDITVLGIDDIFKNMIKYGIEQSDAVTAVSDSLVRQTRQVLDIDQTIDVIYNFVNEQEYHKKNIPFLKESYDIKPNEKVIIHISNFRKVKRVQDVIRTFERIQQHLDSKLLLVGDGPEYSEAYKLAEDLGIQNRILWLGKQKNISDLLSISDLKLLMSEKESFGLVLLEAMACEVPCIATNIGGVPEVVEHKETGYIVEVGDIEQASRYAVELLQDGQKLHEFSNRAAYQAKTHFGSEKILQAYLNVYENVLHPDKGD